MISRRWLRSLGEPSLHLTSPLRAPEGSEWLKVYQIWRMCKNIELTCTSRILVMQGFCDMSKLQRTISHSPFGVRGWNFSGKPESYISFRICKKPGINMHLRSRGNMHCENNTIDAAIFYLWSCYLTLPTPKQILISKKWEANLKIREAILC